MVVQAYRNGVSRCYATGDGIISMFCVGDRISHLIPSKKWSAKAMSIYTMYSLLVVLPLFGPHH